MVPYQESELRRLADVPTIWMTDLWHSLCNKLLGRSIEVEMCRRVLKLTTFNYRLTKDCLELAAIAGS